jgi:hypothetical protein
VTTISLRDVVERVAPVRRRGIGKPAAAIALVALLALAGWYHQLGHLLLALAGLGAAAILFLFTRDTQGRRALADAAIAILAPILVILAVVALGFGG